MSNNLKTGIKGEHIAAQYLKNLNYEILELNWRFDHKEIDIIARDKNCLIVVEVKTRTNKFFHDPVEDITLKKQSFLIHAAEEYLYRNKLDLDVRFDIILIFIRVNRTTLEHIRDAFHPIA
ncbi:MAG: YraN family protein [Bacteroidales bacterium]|nr:YraN family protein [Bacteroidales bacterium]